MPSKFSDKKAYPPGSRRVKSKNDLPNDEIPAAAKSPSIPLFQRWTSVCRLPDLSAFFGITPLYERGPRGDLFQGATSTSGTVSRHTRNLDPGARADPRERGNCLRPRRSTSGGIARCDIRSKAQPTGAPRSDLP